MQNHLVSPRPSASASPEPQRARAQSVNYDVMFNGYQGPAEIIPFTDPLVAVPANVGPSTPTPWSVHVTLAEANGTASGSVWVSWSTGTPVLATNPAQINQSAAGADIYIDDYPQPPTYPDSPFFPSSAATKALLPIQPRDPAAPASQARHQTARRRPHGCMLCRTDTTHDTAGALRGSRMLLAAAPTWTCSGVLCERWVRCRSPVQ